MSEIRKEPEWKTVRVNVPMPDGTTPEFSGEEVDNLRNNLNRILFYVKNGEEIRSAKEGRWAL